MHPFLGLLTPAHPPPPPLLPCSPGNHLSARPCIALCYATQHLHQFASWQPAAPALCCAGTHTLYVHIWYNPAPSGASDHCFPKPA